MQQRKNLLSSLLFGAVFVASLFTWGGATAFAETSVTATVCGADAQSAVTIASPPSDSTVSTTNVSITGTIVHSSQADVFVDGVYDQTIALQPNQTGFELVVRTVPGTHTIRIESIGVCGGKAAAEAVVSVVPSQGGSSQSDRSQIDDLSSTTIEGAVIEPINAQDTQEVIGRDVVSFLTPHDESKQTSGSSSLVAQAREYVSTVVFVASVATIGAVAVSVQTGAAASIFGLSRRSIVGLAVVGILTALFSGI